NNGSLLSALLLNCLSVEGLDPIDDLGREEGNEGLAEGYAGNVLLAHLGHHLGGDGDVQSPENVQVSLVAVNHDVLVPLAPALHSHPYDPAREDLCKT